LPKVGIREVRNQDSSRISLFDLTELSETSVSKPAATASQHYRGGAHANPFCGPVASDPAPVSAAIDGPTVQSSHHVRRR
jgi:hypothetical protein